MVLRIPIVLVHRDLSIVLRTTINGHNTNALVDTGAGCCVIDLGSVKKFVLTSQIDESFTFSKCLAASGNEMKIAGTIQLDASIIGARGIFSQQFRLLNSESCNNIIVGRDFFKFYEEITFDFHNNRIKVGKSWLQGISINTKQSVSGLSDVVIPPRSEQVITVH